MEKWEYLRCWNIDEDKLEELGQKGWELITCSFVPVKGECYVFKRLIKGV